MNAKKDDETPENEEVAEAVEAAGEADAEAVDESLAGASGGGSASDAQEIEVVSIEGLIEKTRSLGERLRRSEEALKRERADVINYRRRVESRMEETREALRGELASDLFAFFDTVFHTAQGLEKHEDFEGLREAFSALARELDGVFEAWGLRRVGEPGEPFDPERHEAVFTRTDEGVESPEVDEVVSPGYMQGDRILRAAQVAVRQPPKREQSDTASDDDEAGGETGADV